MGINVPLDGMKKELLGQTSLFDDAFLEELKTNSEEGYVKDKDCTVNTPVRYGVSQEPVYGKGVFIYPRIDGRKDSRHFEDIYLDRLLPLEEYDKIIVLFSGGKDSLACYLKLLEMGVPKEKIELWHHDIDGGNTERCMDWPCTNSYVRAFAQAEDVTLRISYRVGGFFAEVYRVGAAQPVEWIDPVTGEVMRCKLSPKQKACEDLREQLRMTGDKEVEKLIKEFGYRYKFPAKAADLRTRWCSSQLKISVADSVIAALDALDSVGGSRLLFPAKGAAYQGRWCSNHLKISVADSVIAALDAMDSVGGSRLLFPAKGTTHQGRWCSGTLKASVQDAVTSNVVSMSENTRILVVSGERRGESTGRSRYNELEKHRTNAEKKAHRTVHQWRAVIDWSEKDVWEIIKRHHINPHPCYRAGWNRCSCCCCVFSSPRHLKGISEILPDVFEALKEDERELDFTFDAKCNLDDYIKDAESCLVYDDADAIDSIRTGNYLPEQIYVPADAWKYPVGAFHGSDGGSC